ncbi:BMT4 [[Candida] subhashii]|uniref:BMT4 n=1 Tax=[Candida] subhashii TaxID=561895 RepID=A0A8J5QFZ9_9ASCO|nr:BMT4 [[Candida] subhashii]KAG7662262.1 BMT4 [[Candida] subhashii]
MSDQIDIRSNSSSLALCLLLLILLTPVSIIIFIKSKSTPKGSRFILYLLIIILNLNIWYLLLSEFQYNNEKIIKQINSPLSESIYDFSFKSFKVPGYSFIEAGNEYSSKDFKCSQVQFEDTENIQSTRLFELNKKQDLKIFRDQINKLRNKRKIYDVCFQDGPNETEEEILNTKWFKFCGSSVWLSKYNVHFMVHRIVYTKNAHRNGPTISILAGQVFDKDWKELTGFKFPNSNLTFPTILPHYIDAGRRKEKNVLGSEDPRIILHEFINSQGEQDQEPMIVFNSRRTDINWNRAMHVYRPLHDSYKIVRLSINGKKRSFREKNWAPFMDPSAGTNNTINFVYNFNPLRVVQCDVLSGECNKISGPDFNKDANDNAGKLRGGTNIIQIDSKYLPEKVQDRLYWFGIARSHIESCGCLHELYRPHAFIMSRPKNSQNFTLDYVSSLIDFNISPEPWNDGEGVCSDGKSVLIPNSIAYWDALPSSNNNNDGSAIDYMGLTVSEADKTNRMIHMKGWLSHIYKILDGDRDTIKKHYNAEGFMESENLLLGECATNLAQDYCRKSEKLMKWD